MQQRTLHIKGMVCERCISFVAEALTDAGVGVARAELGEVTLAVNAGTKDVLIEERLSALGFQLMQNPQLALTKQAKALVAEVYSGAFDFETGFRFSALLAKRLATPYDAVNAAFKNLERTTIEKYVIDYRIGKTKEFLVYTHRSLADISFALGFSSVSHLSKQFKSHTGLNPSHFKAVKRSKETQTASAR